MPRLAVLDKADMYRRLAAGEFGNTIPQYFDYAEWIASDPAFGSLWGVRTLTPGGPCRLNCPAAEVGDTITRFHPHKPNISMMVESHSHVTAWIEVCDVWSGERIVRVHEYPKTPGETWRNTQPFKAKDYTGVAGRLLLSKHLNWNSYEDLCILLEEYPGHVVELSALERCYGTVPHRNAIVWEVRKY